MSTDTELIAWYFIRTNYESKKHGYNVPSALKYLIRNFSMKIFQSKILSIKQDLDLIQLLITAPLSFTRANLLYRASENKFRTITFHGLCDDKGPTITIVKSNFGNIFGGYTNIPWSMDGCYHSKNGATFVFLLHSHSDKILYPKVWKYKEDEKYGEVRHFSWLGPQFGAGIDMAINGKKGKCYGHSFFDKDEIEVISGGNSGSNPFFLNEWEVYEIKH